jgi:hypothetical protein
MQNDLVGAPPALETYSLEFTKTMRHRDHLARGRGCR